MNTLLKPSSPPHSSTRLGVYPRVRVPSPSRMAGASLISTMVGIVISLLTVGAMLTTYRLMGDTSLEVNKEMVRDGQVMSSLQTLSMELQQSGFGTTDGDLSKDLWVSTDGKKISWRYKPQLDSAATACKGVEIVAQGSEQRAQGMYLYTSPTCTTAAQTDIWSHAPAKIASSLAFAGTEGETGALTLAQTVFTKGVSEKCSPFQSKEEDEQHPTVSLTSAGTLLFKSCLTNIVVP